MALSITDLLLPTQTLLPLFVHSSFKPMITAPLAWFMLGWRPVIEDQRLTMVEVFSLFGRPVEETRWVACADSEEFLAVVIYLTQRTDGGSLGEQPSLQQ